MRRTQKLDILIKQFRCDGLYREASRIAQLGRDDDAIKCFGRAEEVRYGPGGIGLWYCYFRGPSGNIFDPFCEWSIKE